MLAMCASYRSPPLYLALTASPTRQVVGDPVGPVVVGAAVLGGVEGCVMGEEVELESTTTTTTTNKHVHHGCGLRDLREQQAVLIRQAALQF